MTTTEHPIEARLDYFDPADLPALNRHQLTHCYRNHYRELTALLMDAHNRIVMIEGSAKGAVGALEMAQREFGIITQMATLLSQAQELDKEREATNA